jgi:hypothetical protein
MALALVNNPCDRVDTPEQAIAYAQYQVNKLAAAVHEAHQARMVENQRRLYQIAMLRYGCALGTLATLRATGRLLDDAYERLRRRTQELMRPQVSE